MPQTLKLKIKSYDLVLGSNTQNPLGLRIGIAAEQGGTPQNLRLWFIGTDEDFPEVTNIGFRASDGALAVFLPRPHFASYVLMLDQAMAVHIEAQLEDNGNITSFELSTNVSALRDDGFRESDRKEFRERAAESQASASNAAMRRC